MEQLMTLATELGLTIVESHGKHLAGYLPEDHIIRLTPNLPRRAARSLMAHEIGHHLHGHTPTPFGPLHARQERAANQWAAKYLIDMRAYAEAEHLRNGHLPSIAFDLDVTNELVTAYQQLLARHPPLETRPAR